MRRSASLQGLPPPPGVNRDARMGWLVQGVVADENAPRRLWSLPQATERRFQVVKVNDAICPVEASLHTPGGVDRRHTNSPAIQFHHAPDSVMLAHELRVAVKWPQNARRKMIHGCIVVAGCNDGFKREPVQPPARGFKLATPAALRNVPSYNHRIGLGALGKAGDCVKRYAIFCSEMYVGQMQEAKWLGHCHAFSGQPPALPGGR